MDLSKKLVLAALYGNIYNMDRRALKMTPRADDGYYEYNYESVTEKQGETGINGYDRSVELRQSWEKRQSVEKCLDSLRILFTHHSRKIDNSETTWRHARQIFENDRIADFTGNPCALQNLRRH